MSVRNRLRVLSAALACSACLGCGGGWEAETYPASGRVSINGRPAAGALVQLHPIGKTPDVRNSRPWGLVGDDGTFTLSTYESGDGAPAGEYKFTITWPIDPSVPSMTDRLGFRYSRPERSDRRIAIKEGSNALPPIDMVNVKVDMGPKSPGPKSPSSARPKSSRRAGPFMPGMPDGVARGR